MLAKSIGLIDPVPVMIQIIVVTTGIDSIRPSAPEAGVVSVLFTAIVWSRIIE